MTPQPVNQHAAVQEAPALKALIAQLRERHHDAIEGVLVYGSCLRSGDIFDGLLDVYLLCRDYRSAYQGRWLRLANWLLPPNVFYAECEQAGQVLRSKVTVISVDDFSRGCSRAWFQSYIWGRFAQPTLVAWSRDAMVLETIDESLSNASATLLERCLPALPATGSLKALWEQALGLSYDTELRTERSGRATELVDSAADYYAEASRRHSGSLSFPFDVYDEGYKSKVPLLKRRMAKPVWLVRKLQGKMLSILRLVKALFTFEGGLDYIAWKLERHSGQEIEIPDRVRKRPLLYLWGFFWGLYQRGVFK